jgi:hypothetical protein
MDVHIQCYENLFYCNKIDTVANDTVPFLEASDGIKSFVVRSAW